MFNCSKILTSLIILTTLNLVACGRPTDSSVPGNLELGGIVNGKAMTAKNELSHSIVALIIDTNKGQAMCTGTLVSNQVVLTAAHCVDHSPKNLRIVFSRDLHLNKGAFLEADKIIQNSLWGEHSSTGEGDLALVHFKGTIPEDFKKVNLVDENFNLLKHQKVLLAGFGVTDGESKSGSGKLRQTSSTILDRHSATELIIDGEKSGVCFGDSGGPAFIKKGKEFIQWGVASSVSDANCNDTSIHTELQNYIPWINSTLKKLH